MVRMDSPPWGNPATHLCSWWFIVLALSLATCYSSGRIKLRASRLDYTWLFETVCAIIVLKRGERLKVELETELYDSEAMRYLSYVLFPLVIAGAVYQLLYSRYKRCAMLSRWWIVITALGTFTMQSRTGIFAQLGFHILMHLVIFDVLFLLEISPFIAGTLGWYTAWSMVCLHACTCQARYQDCYSCMPSVFIISLLGVYAFGFLFMLPQLFLNYKVCIYL